MAIIDPDKAPRGPAQPRGLMAAAPPPAGDRSWLDGGLDPTRYRVLRKTANGAYQPLAGGAFVTRYDLDPNAWVSCLVYARSVRPSNRALSEGLLAELNANLPAIRAAFGRPDGAGAADTCRRMFGDDFWDRLMGGAVVELVDAPAAAEA